MTATSLSAMLILPLCCQGNFKDQVVTALLDGISKELAELGERVTAHDQMLSALDARLTETRALLRQRTLTEAHETEGVLPGYLLHFWKSCIHRQVGQVRHQKVRFDSCPPPFHPEGCL